MTLAGVAGQVGCLTLGIVFVALFAGLGLDRLLNTKPLFTLILLIGSVPLTLYLMFRIVKAATDRIQPAAKTDSVVEEKHRGSSS
jgi:threonine/homoserine/homoserine lactone efflux protein